MTCQECRLFFPELIEGDIDPQFLRDLWRHFGDCANCCRELAMDLCADAAARGLPSPPPPAQLWREIERLLDPVSKVEGSMGRVTDIPPVRRRSRAGWV